MALGKYIAWEELEFIVLLAATAGQAANGRSSFRLYTLAKANQPRLPEGKRGWLRVAAAEGY
jgi:hypothetical protein